MVSPPGIRIAGQPLDLCRVLDPLTITYGTTSPAALADAPSAVFTVDGEPFLPEITLEVGQPVEIDVYDPHGYGWPFGVPPGWRPRFRGRISDLTTSRAGDTVRTQVVCTGRQADLANRRLGTTPWPLETIEARYQHIVALMPEWSFEWNQISLSADMVAPQDVDSYGALQLLQELAVAARVKFYETTAGTFVMKMPGRQGIFEQSSLGTVHECAIIDSRQWGVSAGDVVNHVTVAGFIQVPGNPPTYTERERTAQDTASITAHGYKHQHIATILIDAEDAPVLPRATLQYYADGVVADWRIPRWSLPQVVVDGQELERRAPAVWAALVAADPWSIVTLPATSAIPIDTNLPTDFYLMGWREVWESATSPGAPARHTMTLALGRRLRMPGDSAAAVQILGPVEPVRWRDRSWHLRVRVIDVETGQPFPGVTVTASIAGPNTAGPPATTGPDGAATVEVPTVDAANVTVNVAATGPGLPPDGVDASARYSLTAPVTVGAPAGPAVIGTPWQLMVSGRVGAVVSANGGPSEEINTNGAATITVPASPVSPVSVTVTADGWTAAPVQFVLSPPGTPGVGAGWTGYTWMLPVSGPPGAVVSANGGPTTNLYTTGAGYVIVPAMSGATVPVTVTINGWPAPARTYSLRDPGDATWEHVPPATRWEDVNPATTWAPPLELADL